MDAIILAGGKGTRMRPLTDHTPKPLLTVRGKPILEWSLRSLRPVADHVLVVAKYLKPQIEAYMAAQTIFEHYTIVEQTPQPLGTGHAVQCCQPHLKSASFLVVNGDDIYDNESLRQLADTEAGLLAAHKGDQSRWGVLVTGDDGRLLHIDEKPAEGTYPTPVQINIGAYKLTDAVFDHDLPKSERGEYEITGYVSYLADRTPMQVIPAAFWLPIGTVDDYEQAQSKPLERWMP